MKKITPSSLVKPPALDVFARIDFGGIRPDALSARRIVGGQIPSDAEIGEELRFLVEATQTFFWDALRKLETHLGFEVDSQQDFQEATLEDLKASPGAPV